MKEFTNWVRVYRRLQAGKSSLRENLVLSAIMYDTRAFWDQATYLVKASHLVAAAS